MQLYSLSGGAGRGVGRGAIVIVLITLVKG
jgi:hypothetical protein